MTDKNGKQTFYRLIDMLQYYINRKNYFTAFHLTQMTFKFHTFCLNLTNTFDLLLQPNLSTLNNTCNCNSVEAKVYREAKNFFYDVQRKFLVCLKVFGEAMYHPRIVREVLHQNGRDLGEIRTASCSCYMLIVSPAGK